MTTVLDVQRFKEERRRFAMLTAYDFLSARILDEAGIPVLLVGDSLGMVMLGYPTTLPVTMDDMLHHAKAVSRGVRQALLVGDMPFMSYQASVDEAVANAGRFLQEAGMHAVKLEGGGPQVVAITRRLTEIGIPVMGHLGLTPQSVHGMGGFKVQGKTPAQATHITDAARSSRRQAPSASSSKACRVSSPQKSRRPSAFPPSASGRGQAQTARCWSSTTCSESPPARRPSS